MTEIFIGEREKWIIKGMISSRRLILFYNKSYPTFVPNFKILGAVVPEKSLTKKKSLHTHTQTHTNIADSKAHIPPAIAIRGMLKQFCRCKFLMLANW